jgi:hypothetical protein
MDPADVLDNDDRCDTHAVRMLNVGLDGREVVVGASRVRQAPPDHRPLLTVAAARAVTAPRDRAGSAGAILGSTTLRGVAADAPDTYLTDQKAGQGLCDFDYGADSKKAGSA